MKIKRKGKLALFIIGILLLVVSIPHVFADYESTNVNNLPIYQTELFGTSFEEYILMLLMGMILIKPLILRKKILRNDTGSNYNHGESREESDK
jgi:hypothetical protein